MGYRVWPMEASRVPTEEKEHGKMCGLHKVIEHLRTLVHASAFIKFILVGFEVTYYLSLKVVAGIQEPLNKEILIHTSKSFTSRICYWASNTLSDHLTSP